MCEGGSATPRTCTSQVSDVHRLVFTTHHSLALYLRSTQKQDLIMFTLCPQFMFLNPCFCICCLASIICLPRYFYRKRKAKALDQRAEQRRQIEAKNKDNLTVKLQQDREAAISQRSQSLSAGRTETQEHSLLFTKLPIKLRMRVYDLVMCPTGRVHVQFDDGRSCRYYRNPRDVMCLVSSECVLEDEYDMRNHLHACLHAGDKEKAGWAHKGLGVNLLQTCRRM